MIKFNISYYDNSTPWSQEVGKEFLIRGFAYRETISPMMIHNGDKPGYPWPWLLMFFHDPVTIVLNGSTEKVKENSLMIWPAGIAHHYGNDTRKWTHSWLIVDFQEMRQFQKNYSLPVGKPFNTDAGDIFCKYLGMFHEELKREIKDVFFQQNLLQLFLYDLYRQCKHNFIPVPHRLQEMERYLSSHLHEDLTVETIATRFGISAPHFRTLFRKHFKVSPIHYLNTLRLNKAAQLLRFYPYSCKEVAELTGFRDPLYFSRCFSRFWGVSPREYKESCCGE